MVTVNLVEQAKKVGRQRRMPNHPFHLKEVRPFQIQPCHIAPVFAGETLDNLYLQSRVITDPIVNRIIGWYCEYYFFYVKLSDLADRDTIKQMLIDPDFDASSLQTGTDSAKQFFHTTGTTEINWVDRCLDRVTQTYFRNEGENIDEELLDGLPVAAVNGNDVFNSSATAAYYASTLGDDIDYTSLSEGDSTASVFASEIARYQALYENARNAALIDMSFEDYLGLFGVNVPKSDQNIPELIRYVRDWQNPVNTVDPSSGTPTTAVSWSLREKATKKRAFKEHGFVFGVQVVRPKVYRGAQRGTATSVFNSMHRWMMPLYNDDPHFSLVDVTNTFINPPSLDISLDLKDLMMHGEQFINWDPAGLSDGTTIDLPEQDASLPEGVNWSYPDATMIDTLFSDTVTPKKYIESDGIVSLSIRGRMQDTSPVNPGSLVT